jgi:hypothetical protein
MHVSLYQTRAQIGMGLQENSSMGQLSFPWYLILSELRSTTDTTFQSHVRLKPPFAMYYFFQTTVSIAGPLKKIISSERCIPAMEFFHRSCDLGQGFMIIGSNIPSSDQWIRYSLLESTIDIYFVI